MSEKARQGLRRKLGLYFLVAVMMFILTYLAFYVQATKPDGSDTTVHMATALSFDRVLQESHCGWHLICWLFYVCLPITIEEAAAASTAAFNAVTALLILWMGDAYLCRNRRGKDWPWAVAVSAAVSMLVGPLYLRFYNPRYYLGQGTPNTWHNPTTTAVRPFMLLITVLTVGYWDCPEDVRVTVMGKSMKKTTVYELALGGLLLYSTITKPSYLMIYLPVCGVRALVLLARGRGKGFWRLVARHLYFVPSLCVLAYQYLSIYFTPSAEEDSSQVVIALFRVARMHAPSVLISLFLRMAFPFLVIVIWRKVIFRERYFPLIFGQYLTGLFISWTFAETGRRATHGNFGWGNVLGSSFLWIFCLFFFVKQFLEEKEQIAKSRSLRVKYGALFLLLAWHLAGGICYYLKLV